MKPIFKIHPAIGVARIGNAPNDFFVGPGPSTVGPPTIGTIAPPFKDGAGFVKREAAPFQVWRYLDNGKGKYVADQEVNLLTKDVEWIEWTVHLANKKADFFEFRGLLGDPVNGPPGIPPVRRNASVLDRKKLWIDPGPRTIRGKSAGPVQFKKGMSRGTEYWPDPAPSPVIDYLGELLTDATGRLLVLGGRGTTSFVYFAEPIASYANNDGWFDDVSDGPVTAKIKFKGQAPVDAVGAWVLCGPPDFAPGAEPIVTLYDCLLDVAARELTLPTNDAAYDSVLNPLAQLNAELKGRAWGKVSLTKYKPSFDTDIWPVLRRSLAATYLYGPARTAHSLFGASGITAVWPMLSQPTSAGNGLRGLIFGTYLHEPGKVPWGAADTMPKLLGDDPYWNVHSEGGWGKEARSRLTLTPTQYAMFEQWAKGNFIAGSASPPGPASVTSPQDIDRIWLERCVGGAFFPGIECGWQIRHPALYAEPFRIKHDATTQYVSDAGTIGPGHFSRQMALPWQADFLMCRQETRDRINWGWWPSQRPDFVYSSQADALARNNSMGDWTRATVWGLPTTWRAGGATPNYSEFVANWWKFGFVIEQGGVQFETERPRSVP